LPVILSIFVSQTKNNMNKKHLASAIFGFISLSALAQPTGGTTTNDLQLNTITTAVPFMAIRASRSENALLPTLKPVNCGY
jgi:hypothetical protein